jgi:hypothetical protein
VLIVPLDKKKNVSERRIFLKIKKNKKSNKKFKCGKQ